MDIVIDVVEVLHELTDEDVGEEADGNEEDSEGHAASLKLLIESLVSSTKLTQLFSRQLFSSWKIR